MADEAIVLDVDGTDVTVSHPDKVFFNQRGETKLDLVRYYQAVASPLLETLRDRPAARRSSRSASRSQHRAG
jgi:DNA primase